MDRTRVAPLARGVGEGPMRSPERARRGRTENRSRPSLLLTTVVAALVLGLPMAAHSQLGGPSETVTVSGAAPLDAGRPAARERALQQALRLAVEQVAGVIVESETIVRNLALFEDNILTRTDGYVRSFEILFEEEADGILRIEADVEVVRGRLTRDLQSIGLLLRRANYPVVSMQMRARDATGAPLAGVDGPLESEARAILRERGLEVVDRTGRGMAPTVRIEGSIELSDAGDVAGTGLMSSTAWVSLDAIESATGTVMVAAGARSRGAGISRADARDRAGMRAVEAALERLVENLVNEWSSRVNNRDSVMLSVRGVESFEQVARLMTAIEDYYGETEDVVERQVDVDRGTAYLEWRGRGNAGGLIRWLSGREVADYRIVVVGTGGNLIRVEITESRGSLIPAEPR